MRNPSKIEVTEVFWFGCNHCYALEPYIARWKRDIPSDVTFIKSPATWNEMLKTHANIYFTAKALGIEQQFVPAAFNTIQNEGRYVDRKHRIRVLRSGDLILTEINIKLFLLRLG